MTRFFVPLDNVPFFSFLFRDLGKPSPLTTGQDPVAALQALFEQTAEWQADLGPLSGLTWSTQARQPGALEGVTGLNERPTGLVFYGLTATTDRGHAHAVLYRAPDRWRLTIVHDGSAPTSSEALLETIDNRFLSSPNQELRPCPCCGHRFPAFQQLGNAARPSVVACGHCSFTVESKEEAEQNGVQWNRWAGLAAKQPASPSYPGQAISEVCGAHCRSVAMRGQLASASARN